MYIYIYICKHTSVCTLIYVSLLVTRNIPKGSPGDARHGGQNAGSQLPWRSPLMERIHMAQG